MRKGQGGHSCQLKSLQSSFPQTANPDYKHEPVFTEAAAAASHSRRAQGSPSGTPGDWQPHSATHRNPFFLLFLQASLKMSLKHMASFSDTKGLMIAQECPKY